MRTLEGKRVVVVGMGLSGVGAVRLLRQKGARVRAVDQKPKGELEGVMVEPQTEAAFRDAELVVISPGVPADLGVLVPVRARGVPVIGELELAAPFLEGSNIGITGTNGKTTTSNLIDAILREAGHITGVIGTIEYRLAGKVQPAYYTTPEAIDFMRLAAELEKAGGDHLIAEVSSIGLKQGRVHGFHFHTAVFTNLTRDHLDFHGTLEEYGAAKRLLFAPVEGPAPEWAVLNADDPFSATVPRLRHNVLYGLSKQAGLRAEKLESTFVGLHFDLVWEGRRQRIESPLVGKINVLNILAAAGAALSYGLDLEAIARGVAKCTTVPGRFQRVDSGQPFLVVVDYAHTDDALRNVIQIARELVLFEKAGGRVITLFGCGGDRDRSKRPLMGMVVGELSDYVVLTSDNPRSEDPLAIMNDALVGLRRFDTPHAVEPDRARAIRIALEQAKAGDVVLLTGKGHETYQIFKDRTIHFDDRETAREVLRSFGYKK